MKRTLLPVSLFLAFASFAFLTGCGGGPKEETIVIKSTSSLQEAKSILERYAKGQALGSEVAGFPKLIADVRKEDPARGDLLEKGLKDIEAKKGSPAAAKELLNKL